MKYSFLLFLTRFYRLRFWRQELGVPKKEKKSLQTVVGNSFKMLTLFCSFYKTLYEQLNFERVFWHTQNYYAK